MECHCTILLVLKALYNKVYYKSYLLNFHNWLIFNSVLNVKAVVASFKQGPSPRLRTFGLTFVSSSGAYVWTSDDVPCVAGGAGVPVGGPVQGEDGLGGPQPPHPTQPPPQQHRGHELAPARREHRPQLLTNQR